MIIETERLRLREFVEDDWRAVLAYQTDPLYLRYYSWTERTEADVRSFVQMFVEQQRVELRAKYQLAVVLKESGQLIGNCGVRITQYARGEADIGYELDPRHWNKGYATEAARAMLDFGFEALNLHRIWAECVAENVGSARVLEKIGMRQEGRLREKIYLKGRWHDQLIYAILAAEWREQQRDE